MASLTQQIAERLKQHGVIAIARGNFTLDEIVGLADALLAASVRVLEVTANSAGALEAIGRLRGRLGGQMIIGAGTIRSANQVTAAISAGAEFLIAPCLDLDTIARAQANDVLLMPGVFTATEAQAAFRAGCKMVKLFPCDGIGPGYLKALRAPLDDVEFVPTGGITADNIAAYARAGAVAVAVGSSLIAKGVPRVEIMARARRLHTAWEQAKRG